MWISSASALRRGSELRLTRSRFVFDAPDSGRRSRLVSLSFNIRPYLTALFVFEVLAWTMTLGEPRPSSSPRVCLPL